MQIPLKEIPDSDRPRERLARLGPGVLSEAELLALVIRSGGPGGNAVQVGQALLAEYGGAGGLAKARADILATTPSMGMAKAAAVVAAFELGRRAGAARDQLPRIRDAGDIAALVRGHMVDPSREEAFVLVVGPLGRVLKVERLTVGTDNRCLLEPRDVLKTVIQKGGTAFAVAHSHPGGALWASAQDLAATQAIARLAEATGISFLDHVVVTEAGWRSLIASSASEKG